MKSRIPLPALDQLNPCQQELVSSIQQSRGSLDGPFLAWLHSPEFASKAEQLGAFCRYDTGLAPIETELLILVVAVCRRCRAEWQIHAPLAASAGLDDAAIAAIETGATPLLPTERLIVLHELAHQLLQNDSITVETYQRAEQLLGTTQLVEAVGVIGYYSLVACTLNAFDMSIE